MYLSPLGGGDHQASIVSVLHWLKWPGHSRLSVCLDLPPVWKFSPGRCLIGGGFPSVSWPESASAPCCENKRQWEECWRLHISYKCCKNAVKAALGNFWCVTWTVSCSSGFWPQSFWTSWRNCKASVSLASVWADCLNKEYLQYHLNEKQTLPVQHVQESQTSAFEHLSISVL